MVSQKLNHFVRQLFTLLLAFNSGEVLIHADDRVSANSDGKIHKSASRDTPLANSLNGNFLRISHGLFTSKIEVPPMPRISRSRLPMRQIKLTGNDHFVAECLDWNSKSATFRLLNGQTIQLPRESVSGIQNPPGEIDLVDESFDDQRPADERGLTGDDKKFRYTFTPPSNARVELNFQTSIVDATSSCGEWQIDWKLNQIQQPPLVVRIGPKGLVTVSGLSTANEATSQSLTLSDGSHSFIALFMQDRIRLILDDAHLASLVAKDAEIQAIEIRLPDVSSNNILRVENFQARRLGSFEPNTSSNEEPGNSDRIELSSGDDLFCQLIGLNRSQVNIEAFGERQALRWQDITAIQWRQPEIPITQSVRPHAGIVAHIEMQPFVDRPECEPDRWTVTVVGVDATHLRVMHPLAGEIVFRCSDIRRLIPLYFGQSFLVDARTFHLGNSIRSDLHRHIPDGIDLRGEFQLKELPNAKAYISFDLAELEASSPDAPPGSPFLAELRAGHLVTELLVNDQKIGILNEMIRYKANRQHPDRIRMAIPNSLLKPGNNTFRFRQQPLKQGRYEYDDCELGDIRLEFEN